VAPLKTELLVAADVVPSSLILPTPMMYVTLSPETSLLTRATQRNVNEEGSSRHLLAVSIIKSPQNREQNKQHSGKLVLGLHSGI
jgi:hypothetical protein